MKTTGLDDRTDCSLESSGLCSSRFRTSPTIPRSSSRCWSSGSARTPSSGCDARTPAARSGASSTARSRRTGRWASTTPGVARSRTSSSATRRCAGSTSATRTGSTARGSGSRSASSARSGSTRSGRSRSSASRSSRAAAARSSCRPPPRSPRARQRLGQWMDWGNDYFTFSDTNIEYVWRMLKRVHEQGWLYLGHRSTEWCPRCGTSISGARAPRQLRGSERSVALRPLPVARPRARVARHLDDDAVDAARERRRRREAGRRVRPSRERRVGRRRAVSGGGVRRAQARRGPRRLALPRARSTSSRPPRTFEHRVIPWDEVSLEDGTGIVHIAPGAGQEDFELGRVHDLPVLSPGGRGRPLLRRLRLAARALDDRGRRPDHRLARRARDPPRGGAPHAPLPALLALRHAAHLAGHRRLAHLRRGAAAAAAARERGCRVDAGLHGQADGRLAPQHGRLEHLAAAVLRPAAAVLPVRVRPPERDRVEGGAARARDRRRRAARGAAAAVDRRGADRV